MSSRLLGWTLWSLMVAFAMGCAAREPAPTSRENEAPPAVTIVAAPAAAPAAEPEPQKETARVTSSRLNLRSGASSKSSILGVLIKGDTLAVLSRHGGWVEVQSAEGLRGWVAARYIAPEQTSPDVEAPGPAAKQPPAAAAAGPSRSGALSRKDGLTLYNRFRRALADGDLKAFLSVVYAPREPAGKTAPKDPSKEITPESFDQMKDFILEMSPDPAACKMLKFDSDDQAAILVFQSDLNNADSITLSSVMMAAAEGEWKIVPGSYDDTFPRQDPRADKAAISEKLKTNPKLQLSAVAAQVSNRAEPEVAPPATTVPAAANAAEGELVVNGEATALKYAYAYSEPGFFDKSKLDTVVILSNMALDEEALTDWTRRQKLEKSGELRCVELTIDAEGRVISRKLRHSAFEASPSGVSSDEVFEPRAAGEGLIAGRAYSTRAGEFFGVTYRYQAAFKAQIRQATGSSDSATAMPARANIFNNSPEHEAIVKMLEAEGESEILQTASGVGMSIMEDFAAVGIDYEHLGKAANTLVYLFKEDGGWVAYRKLPTRKDHSAVFLILAQQYCAPRYEHLQGADFLDESWQSKDPRKRTINIDCSELIDNQWHSNNLSLIYQYDPQAGWAITGALPYKAP